MEDPQCAQIADACEEGGGSSVASAAASPAVHPALEEGGDGGSKACNTSLDALAVRLDAHARTLRSDLLDYFLALKEVAAQQRRQVCSRAGGQASERAQLQSSPSLAYRGKGL